MSLRVNKAQGGYAVFDGRDQITGRFANRHDALNRMDKIAAKRRAKGRVKKRKCLTCPETFMSEGPHNRMCHSCRTKKRDDGTYGSSLPRSGAVY